MNNSQSDNNNNSGMTQREKAPAFQFYPKDFLTDGKVLCMSNEVVGMYIKLLAIDWLEDGIPAGLFLKLTGFEWFNENCELRGDSEAIEAQLADCFIPHPTIPGRVTNPRLLKERQKQAERREERSKAGKNGAEAKKSKRLSAEAELKLSLSKAQAKSSSSSSSSSSDQIQIHTNSEQPPIEVQTEAVQLPLAQVLPMVEALPTPKPAGRARKVKNKLTNLVDMTEAELISLGKHPSPLAPRHLTRKKEELEPQDDEAANARVWLTQSELERLREKWGDEKLFALIERASQYFGIQPAKAKDYADHNLLLQNWERR